jgi:Fur family iron response transcriptional regulator
VSSENASATTANPGGETARERAGTWLRAAGLRPTRQRMILAALLIGDGHNRHVTAESLFEAAESAGTPVSLATVYNTLKSFTQAGLLSEITVDGTRSYFDTNTHDHPHFFWEDDGHLSDAPHDSVGFSALPEAPDGAEIAKIDVVIRLRRRD